MRSVDVAVIGGGIVGLATAFRFVESHRGAHVAVLEKEDELAAHQTGRNSGVIHSGIYYKPGSLKAQTCRRGKEQLIAFCREHEVAHEICGKVVVALDERELPQLQMISERAAANGVSFETVDAAGLRRLEPHAAGINALHVRETGIVDYVGVCAKLAAQIRLRGGDIHTSAKVVHLESRHAEVVLRTASDELTARVVINCAGLQSDRLLQLAGLRRPARIVPFRGEYFALVPSAHDLVRNLIYPVPDPRFPFLGVHFTRMALGGVECGPNAVPALAREGYHWDDIRLTDMFDVATYPGFWKLAARYWKTGSDEIRRSLSKRAFTKALQRLLPDIRAKHLEPGPAGVRAQALGPDGSLVDDFLIVSAQRVVHVLNAPSPAATASLAIGEAIVERAQEYL